MEYEPPIPLERINEMIAALKGAEPLSNEMRAELIDAMDCLYVTILEERRAATRGRPEAAMTWHLARLAAELVDRYGATVKAAIIAAAPGANASVRDRLARAYRKLRASDAVETCAFSESFIAEAAARLPHTAQGRNQIG